MRRGSSPVAADLGDRGIKGRAVGAPREGRVVAFPCKPAGYSAADAGAGAEDEADWEEDEEEYIPSSIVLLTLPLVSQLSDQRGLITGACWSEQGAHR